VELYFFEINSLEEGFNVLDFFDVSDEETVVLL
jgi:hypothetical protein